MEVRLGRRFQWVGVALVAGVIFYGSVLDSPGASLSPTGPLGLVGLDKWLHALGYAALGAALAVALRGDADRAILLAVVVSVGYGVGIEFVQAAIPARHFSVADMAADTVGAAVGAGATAGLLRLLERVRRRAAAERM
ncbi:MULTISPECIES: VanZ family protein [Halorussus]|uniref:VanZ family protein n=1 Tax=Halorussus TaxID=1070314 RepID=UPI00209EB4A4|nr:VanZ family protein [Halorussus vallis]USZ77510.1 VanZ family protein [Halorussus vallis]